MAASHSFRLALGGALFAVLTSTAAASQALRGTLTATSTTCVRNNDCTQNAWCNTDGYDSWCESQGLAGTCPSPQCKTASSGPTPAPTTVPTSSTLAPTTPAPTTAEPSTPAHTTPASSSTLAPAPEPT